MKKRISIFLVIIALLSSMVLGACGGGGENNDDVQQSNIELSQTELSLSLFGETEVQATCPDNGTATWTNSNDKVVTMTVNGNVISLVAIGAGASNITATCGEYTKTCTVVVESADEKMVLTSPWQDLELELGGTMPVDAKVQFGASEFNKATITYSSNNPEVATVADGVITAVGVGNATVSVVAEYLGYTSNAIDINVIVKANAGLKLNVANLLLYEPSDNPNYSSEFDINVLFFDGATEKEPTGYQVTTSADTVAELDGNTIKAKKAGATDFTIAYEDGGVTYTALIKVTVEAIPVIEFVLRTTEVKLYDYALIDTYTTEAELNYTALVNDAPIDEQYLRFEVVSGENVASVTNSGIVRALAGGQATIKATVDYKATVVEQTCVVYVTHVDAGAEKLVTSFPNGTLTKDAQTGNYIYDKIYDNAGIPYNDLSLDPVYFEGELVDGNYIVLKMKSTTTSWFIIANSEGNSGYELYDASTKAHLGNVKTPTNTWFYAVYKIGSSYGRQGLSFGTNNQGSSKGYPLIWEIETVEVLTPAEFEELGLTGGPYEAK